MEEIYLNPIERKEFFLAKLGGQEVTPPDAVTRIERYLQDIIDGNASTIPPVTRIEYYLAKISGADVDVPDPVTRTEYYLAKIAGMDVDPPDPITRLDYFLAQWVETGGGVLETVTGNAPITLADALAKAIVSLTQYGLCAQAVTPTPDAPVDIKCNNGTLKMVDDELPAAYKRVLGFNCNNNAMWAITGFKLRGSDTVRISFSVTAACNVFGCYQGTDATDNYDLYVSTTANSKYLRYGNGTYLSYWSSANLGNRFDVVFGPTGTQGMPDDSTWTEMDFTSANDMLIGSTTTTGTSSKLKGNLYGNIEVDGRLKLIPCERLSDNVLGYYDTYSETFFEPATGFDGATSLGYDGSHYQLEVVGTPETLTVRGINLFDKNTMDTGQGYYVNNSGNIVNGYNANRTVWIPCKPNTKYSYWHTEGAGGCRAFAMNKDTIDTSDSSEWLKGSPASLGKNVVSTVTTPADAVKLYITAARSNLDPERSFDEQLADFMVVEGEVAEATAYEPYVIPQTVTDIPMLLGVGDYKDEAGIISGIKTGKVGIKVFDGTETIGTSNACFTIAISDRASSKTALLCSHFPYSSKTSSQTDDCTILSFSSTNIGFRYDACADKTAFAAFLAAQYAAGTPVIVIYPLATETTEQGTAHALHTAEGTNTVSVAAEVSPIALEVVYKSGSGSGSSGMWLLQYLLRTSQRKIRP